MVVGTRLSASTLVIARCPRLASGSAHDTPVPGAG